MSKKLKWPLTKVEYYKRKSVCVEFSDHLDKHGFVEVTYWHNGEGFDVGTGDKQFSLTWSEWQALKKAMKKDDQEQKQAELNEKIDPATI